MVNIQTKTEIIFHFNKMSLHDPSVPMWVVKSKGETYYVDHVDVESGVGFSTKETPSNPHTKGSIKFKAKLKIEKQDNRVVATIYP